MCHLMINECPFVETQNCKLVFNTYMLAASIITFRYWLLLNYMERNFYIFEYNETFHQKLRPASKKKKKKTEKNNETRDNFLRHTGFFLVQPLHRHSQYHCHSFMTIWTLSRSNAVKAGLRKMQKPFDLLSALCGGIPRLANNAENSQLFFLTSGEWIHAYSDDE